MMSEVQDDAVVLLLQNIMKSPDRTESYTNGRRERWFGGGLRRSKSVRRLHTTPQI